MLAAVIGFLDSYYATTVITNFVLWSRRRVGACILQVRRGHTTCAGATAHWIFLVIQLGRGALLFKFFTLKWRRRLADFINIAGRGASI
jgi:hypothetical protein